MQPVVRAKAKVGDEKVRRIAEKRFARSGEIGAALDVGKEPDGTAQRMHHRWIRVHCQDSFGSKDPFHWRASSFMSSKNIATERNSYGTLHSIFGVRQSCGVAV